MLNRELIAVCSQSHTKHINTLCGQNVECVNVKLAVHILITGGTYSYYWRYIQLPLAVHCYHWRYIYLPLAVHIVTTGGTYS